MQRISIITPCFNGGLFLESAILSVLNQRYPHFEHIIVDGGSTDDTLSIIAKYPHLIWISEKDRGMYDAFNKGLKMSSGDIIGSCNSDDTYLPGTFHCVNRFFSANLPVDYVYGDYREVDKDGVSYRVRRDPPFLPFVFRWLSHDLVSCPASFWRRRVHDNGLLFNCSYKYAADYQFHHELLKRGHRLRHMPILFCDFRRHEGALTTVAATAMGREMLEIQRNYGGVIGSLPDPLYHLAAPALGGLAKAIRTAQKLVRGAYFDHFRG